MAAIPRNSFMAFPTITVGSYTPQTNYFVLYTYISGHEVNIDICTPRGSFLSDCHNIEVTISSRDGDVIVNQYEPTTGNRYWKDGELVSLCYSYIIPCCHSIHVSTNAIQSYVRASFISGVPLAELSMKIKCSIVLGNRNRRELNSASFGKCTQSMTG